VMEIENSVLTLFKFGIYISNFELGTRAFGDIKK
jgi:hypothetical protein